MPYIAFVSVDTNPVIDPAVRAISYKNFSIVGAVGANSNNYARTANGTSWTASISGLPGATTKWYDGAWNGRVYCILSDSHNGASVWRSPSGSDSTWVPGGNMGVYDGDYRKLVAGSGSLLCAVTNTHSAISVDNGVSWATVALPTAESVTWSSSTLAFNGTVFCILGSKANAGNTDIYAATSATGNSWTSSGVIAAGATYNTGVAAIQLDLLAHVNGKFICTTLYASGVPIYWMYSSNGVTWTISSSAPSQFYPLSSAVCHYNGSTAFMLEPTGLGGNKSTSTDGITWTNSAVSFAGLAIGYVIRWSSVLSLWMVGNTFTSTIFTSPTGVTWTARTANNGGENGTGLITTYQPWASAATPSLFTGPLDMAHGAVVAFGQRALSNAMLGQSVYTIREDAGNTTQTFSSNSTTGVLNAAAVVSFLAGANGFVTTWHDQSGNGKNATQATTSKQPGWSNAQYGAVPALTFSTSGGTIPDHLDTASITLANGAYTIFAVVNTTSSAGGSSVTGINYSQFAGAGEVIALGVTPDIGNEPNGKIYVDASSDGAVLNEAGGQTVIITGLMDSNKLIDVAWTYGSMSVAVNGVIQSNAGSFDIAAVGSIAGPLAVGADDVDLGSTAGLTGTLAELIIFPTVLALSVRASIRQNIASYYGITL